jgi:hypothetical protein
VRYNCALSGELALEEAMDLLQVKLCNDWTHCSESEAKR